MFSSAVLRACVRASLWLALFALAACDEDSTSPAPQPDIAPRFCLLLESNEPEDLEGILSDFDLRFVRAWGRGHLALVEGNADPALLLLDERVLAVQRDRSTVVSSPVEITQSFFEGDFDTELPAQDALETWQLGTLHADHRGAGVKVAVLDTGVDPTHPLLDGRVQVLAEGASLLGSLEIAGNLDTDGDGEVDEAYGHGTHVAGTIALVAPDAEILSLRVLDSDGVGSAFDLAAGLLLAADWGADVINLSLILSDETEVVEEVLDEVREQGIVVVAAAGNRPGEAFFPADDGTVLSVAALDTLGGLAGFTASVDVDFAAPGVGVVSAFPGELWSSASGTSMASACLSGAVALLTGITGSAQTAVAALENTAGDVDPLERGVVDLQGAVARALEVR